MLDYRFIKENLEAVKKNIIDRNMDPAKADADLVVKLFDERTALTTSLQDLQQKRNANAASMKQKLDPETRQKYIDEGKVLKEQIAAEEAKLNEVEFALDEADRKSVV